MHLNLGTPDTEPVLRHGAGAAALVFVGAFCGTLAGSLQALDPVTPLGVVVAVLLAVSAAVTLAGPVLFAAKAARERAYSPATANELMDADRVIGSAERDGRA